MLMVSKISRQLIVKVVHLLGCKEQLFQKYQLLSRA